MPARYHKINKFTSDYVEGRCLSHHIYKNVLLGNVKEIKKRRRYKNLMKYGKESPAYGWIFSPEHRKDFWTIKKNAAFFKGAVERSKTFRLITNINYCINAELRRHANYQANHLNFFIPMQNRVAKTTIKELLWLINNGYKYHRSVTNDDEVIFERSDKSNSEVVIHDFNPRHYTPEEWQTQVVDKLLKIQGNLTNSTECVRGNETKTQGGCFKHYCPSY